MTSRVEPARPHGSGESPRWRRFVALGDSFTEGLHDDLAADGRHRGWADRVAEHLAERQPDFGYANLAVRGRLAGQVLTEQVPAALGLRPDLVSLGVGVNDALRRTFDAGAVATQVEKSVRQLRGADSDVLLFAFGDPARRSRVMGSVRERLRVLNSATRAIARHYGCYLVDFWGVAVFDEDPLWSSDRLHLSPLGHQIAAQAAMQALGIGDDAWRTPHPLVQAHAVQRASDTVQWAGSHLAPWVARRLRGTSSGDGVTPKRPALTAFPG